jgi:hypothetical protein
MMKFYVFTLLLLINLNLAEANEATSFTEILSGNDQTEILKLIDHICSDSWCAGDYDYKFSAFSCNDTNALCTLSFQIIDRDSKPTETHSFKRRCTFKGISSINNIIRDKNLTEEFYDKLNICVSDRESSSRDHK